MWILNILSGCIFVKCIVEVLRRQTGQKKKEMNKKN